MSLQLLRESCPEQTLQPSQPTANLTIPTDPPVDPIDQCLHHPTTGLMVGRHSVGVDTTWRMRPLRSWVCRPGYRSGRRRLLSLMRLPPTTDLPALSNHRRSSSMEHARNKPLSSCFVAGPIGL